MTSTRTSTAAQLHAVGLLQAVVPVSTRVAVDTVSLASDMLPDVDAITRLLKPSTGMVAAHKIARVLHEGQR